MALPPLLLPPAAGGQPHALDTGAHARGSALRWMRQIPIYGIGLEHARPHSEGGYSKQLVRCPDKHDAQEREEAGL